MTTPKPRAKQRITDKQLSDAFAKWLNGIVGKNAVEAISKKLMFTALRMAFESGYRVAIQAERKRKGE